MNQMAAQDEYTWVKVLLLLFTGKTKSTTDLYEMFRLLYYVYEEIAKQCNPFFALGVTCARTATTGHYNSSPCSLNARHISV